MSNRAELLRKIQELATECHQVACSLDVGDERTEMFDIYGVLHGLTRRGYAGQVSRAMNPLLMSDVDDDDDWLEDEGDD